MTWKTRFLKKYVFCFLKLTDPKNDHMNGLWDCLGVFWIVFEALKRIGIENARKSWKFHFFLQNLQKCYILSLFEHLRQWVGLGGDSRCSFTLGALVLMLWIFPEDHWIMLGDISKPQACTMSPSDYTYSQRKKCPNSLRNSLRKMAWKIRFLKKYIFCFLKLTDPKNDHMNGLWDCLGVFWIVFEALKRIGIENARKSWKFHFFLQNLQKCYILSLFEHLRQWVGLGGDSRCSFTLGALVLMLWIFPEDHWIMLGDISKPQACTMSPSDYMYSQRRKMSKFLKENGCCDASWWIEKANARWTSISFLSYND